MVRTLLLLFFLVPGSDLLFAQAQNDADSAWDRYIKPSAAHSFLKKYEGTWTEEVNMIMNGDSVSYTLTTVGTMVLGNRYLQLSHSGEMAGMAYEETSYLGCNNADGRFILLSMNSMGTGAMVLYGTWLEEHKTIEFEGDMPDPQGKVPVHIKQVYRFGDEDTFSVVNFDVRNLNASNANIWYHFTRQ